MESINSKLVIFVKYHASTLCGLGHGCIFTLFHTYLCKYLKTTHFTPYIQRQPFQKLNWHSVGTIFWNFTTAIILKTVLKRLDIFNSSSLLLSLKSTTILVCYSFPIIKRFINATTSELYLIRLSDLCLSAFSFLILKNSWYIQWCA